MHQISAAILVDPSLQLVHIIRNGNVCSLSIPDLQSVRSVVHNRPSIWCIWWNSSESVRARLSSICQWWPASYKDYQRFSIKDCCFVLTWPGENHSTNRLRFRGYHCPHKIEDRTCCTEHFWLVKYLEDTSHRFSKVCCCKLLCFLYNVLWQHMTDGLTSNYIV